MMTAKDFQKTAEAIALIEDDKTRTKVARVMSSICQANNTRFNTARFYKAIIELRAERKCYETHSR